MDNAALQLRSIPQSRAKQVWLGSPGFFLTCQDLNPIKSIWIEFQDFVCLKKYNIYSALILHK